LNVPVYGINLILIGIISTATILLIKAVGVMLGIAFITLPAASAKNLTYSLKKIQFFSTLISLMATLTGLYTSYVYNLPSGPMIVVMLSLFYIGSVLLKKRQ
jgi:zinc transport system permease protein